MKNQTLLKVKRLIMAHEVMWPWVEEDLSCTCIGHHVDGGWRGSKM